MKRITWINLILGIWLVVSPIVLGHAASTTMSTNDTLFGVLLVACSAWILAGIPAAVGVNWFQALCSLWVIVSPFVLKYPQLSHAMMNDVIVGVIALVVGLVEASALASPPIKA